MAVTFWVAYYIPREENTHDPYVTNVDRELMIKYILYFRQSSLFSQAFRWFSNEFPNLCHFCMPITLCDSTYNMFISGGKHYIIFCCGFGTQFQLLTREANKTWLISYVWWPWLKDHSWKSTLQRRHASFMAAQIICISILITAYSGSHHRKHQHSALIALCEGNPPVKSTTESSLSTT